MSILGESSTASTAEVDPAVNPLGAILAAINSSQRETRELRAELKAAEKADRKAERPYRYQRKGNEEQATFNDGLRDHLGEAELQMSRAARILEEGPAKLALEKAKQSIRMDKEALAHRQKLIKVADRSELGWAVVAEYDADALAADSDDEKRLKRAERVAERKVAAKTEGVEKARKAAREAREGVRVPARWDSVGAPALTKPLLSRPVVPWSVTVAAKLAISEIIHRWITCAIVFSNFNAPYPCTRESHLR